MTSIDGITGHPAGIEDCFVSGNPCDPSNGGITGDQPGGLLDCECPFEKMSCDETVCPRGMGRCIGRTDGIGWPD